jgi:hypothetical protein
MQLVDRWEKIMEAQTSREFMKGAVMGKDGIELWAFYREPRRYKHTGILPLKWERDNIGWQVRKWQLPN